ncbi:MAG: hypothetical protein R6X02_05555 [Enhygromyxa sp.]
MSETSEAIIAQLEAGHELVALGSFTLDVAAARDKLEDYRVADPHTFVLLLVEAAHLFPGCRGIEFEIGPTRTTVSLREVVLDERELQTVLDAADASVAGLEPQAAARMRARQVLGLALITARQLPDVTIELGSSGADSQVVLTGKGPPQFAPRGQPRVPNATWLTIRGPTALPGGEGWSVAAHCRELLRARCRYATVPVVLDATQVSGGSSLAEVEHPYVVRDANARAIALIGRSPARTDATLLLIANGVLIEKLIDHELGAHLVALVHASDLPRDLSLTKLLRQEIYEQRIFAVRQAAASLPPDPWSPAVYLDDRSVVRNDITKQLAPAIYLAALLAVSVTLFARSAWPLLFVLVPVLAAIPPLIPGTRSHRRLHLATLGRPAIATVARSVETIEFAEGERQVLELVIHAPGERSYAAELSLRLGQGSALKPGDRFHVCVDPDDPSRVTPRARLGRPHSLSA